MSPINSLEYKNSLNFLKFPFASSLCTIAEGMHLTRTASKIKGLSFLIFGLYILANTLIAAHFTEKSKKDVLKITSSEDGRERAMPMKMFRTFLISTSPLIKWHFQNSQQEQRAISGSELQVQ